VFRETNNDEIAPVNGSTDLRFPVLAGEELFLIQPNACTRSYQTPVQAADNLFVIMGIEEKYPDWSR
jgi:hypothetical protein